MWCVLYIPRTRLYDVRCTYGFWCTYNRTLVDDSLRCVIIHMLLSHLALHLNPKYVFNVASVVFIWKIHWPMASLCGISFGCVFYMLYALRMCICTRLVILRILSLYITLLLLLLLFVCIFFILQKILETTEEIKNKRNEIHRYVSASRRKE